MRKAIARLVQEMVVECVSPIRSDVMADAPDIDKTPDHLFSGREVVVVVSKRLLVDVAPKYPVVRGELVVDPAHPLVVVERRGNVASRRGKFDGLPEYHHGSGRSKSQIPRLHARGTDRCQGSHSGVVRKCSLQLGDAVRSWRDERSGR